MPEKKMHYFEFHFQKFIAATKGWKDDEVGAFVKLLIEQFDRGFIPDDPEELSRLITSFKKNWPRLKKKFTEPSEPGHLRNTFMCGVRSEAHEKSAKNTENGAKGGRAKKANGIANAIANGIPFGERTGKRNASQPVTSNQEPIEEKNKKEDWNCYPTSDASIRLEEMEVNGAIEWIFRLRQTLLTAERIQDFWIAFLVNLTGKRFYVDLGELLQHFRNWLKSQDFKENSLSKNESGAVRSAVENRTNEILDKFN